MIGDLIEGFKNKLDDNISKSIKENDKKLSEISLNIEVIEEITSHISSDTQIILKEIIHDLISGLYSGLQALYRNAYISLRSGIELSLAYVYFLDHNYEYLFWKQDKYDVRWSVLENEEMGVLNKKYLALFCNDEFENLFNLYIKWLIIAYIHNLSITICGTVFTQVMNFCTALLISSREWKKILLITESFSHPHSSSILFRFGLYGGK